jgi:16S rRNA (guanine527-N7)-methyltransferase
MPRGLVGFDDPELEVARSLLLSPLIRGEWADVGSGAGFPGMPLAMAHGPGTLIEPRRRARGFLERVVRELGVEVALLGMSAEEVATRSQRFATVLTRALAPPEKAVRVCGPLIEEGGRLVITARPGMEASLERVRAQGVGDPRLETVDFGLDLIQSVLIIDKPPTFPNSPPDLAPGE